MIPRILSAFICLVIRFYQRILSPMLKVIAGPAAGCRFTPTCSAYFLQAVELHGPYRGSWFGICRIFRCHPWGGSGYDPVAPRSSPHSRHRSCACHSDPP